MVFIFFINNRFMWSWMRTRKQRNLKTNHLDHSSGAQDRRYRLWPIFHSSNPLLRVATGNNFIVPNKPRSSFSFLISPLYHCIAGCI